MGDVRGQPPPSAQQPAANSSTPTHPPGPTNSGSTPFSPPSAYSQYMAWVSCRREGIPARLVLETDGASEEICFWFRRSADGGGYASRDAAHPPPHTGKRRRERARRRRRREERRRGAEEGQLSSCTATLSSPPPPDVLPSTGNPATLLVKTATACPPTTPVVRPNVLRPRPLPTKRAKAVLTASRASKRAAVLAKKRGSTASRSTPSPEKVNEDEAAPEILREDDGVTALNITLGCSSPPPSPPLPTSTPPSPSSPPPASSPATTCPPPTPPPMSSRFPSYYRRVLCQECFYWDHDYQYYHCIECHMHGPPANKLFNLKKYAIT